MSFLKDFLVGTTGAAEKANKASAATLMAAFGANSSYGQEALLKGLTGLETAYANAEGVLAKQGQAATNQILAGQKQTIDSGTQGLIDKGLYSTSAAGNLASQVQGQTNQSLLQLHEGLGAQQAGLQVSKGQVLNSAQQTLAQYAANKTEQQANITPQVTGQPGFLAGVAGGVGQGLGQAAGKGLAGLFS